jgi:hypothetical protein
MTETALYFNQKMEEIQISFRCNNKSKMFVFFSKETDEFHLECCSNNKRKRFVILSDNRRGQV